jgi:hypothetical protein
MNQDDYRVTWAKLMEESSDLENKRAELEIQIEEIKNQIAHLEEVLNHLAPLAGYAFGGDLAGLGITDAIRTILEGSKERMSAQEMRAALANKGFDLSGYTAPMGSIYKVLGRLADDTSSPVVRERDGTSVFYRWKTEPDPSEISDDDIPF